MALLWALWTAGVCFVVLGLSRLSPFFPSRPSTLHHSLQEEPGVSVSALGPGEWGVLLVGCGCRPWVVCPLSPLTALLSCAELCCCLICSAILSGPHCSQKEPWCRQSEFLDHPFIFGFKMYFCDILVILNDQRLTQIGLHVFILK